MEVYSNLKRNLYRHMTQGKSSHQQHETSLGFVESEISPKTRPGIWDVIVLAQDELDRENKMREKRARDDRLLAHKSYLQRQITQKRALDQLKVYAAAKKDEELLNADSQNAQVDRAERMRRKLTKIRMEQDELSRTMKQLSEKKERELEGKMSDMLESARRKIMYETEQKTMVRFRKNIYREVQDTNMEMTTSAREEKRRSRAEQLERDKKQLAESAQKMKREEKRWASQFRKRILKMERMQSRAAPLRGLLTLADTKEEEEKRITKERTVLDLLWKKRDEKTKEESVTKRREFLESLSKIVREQKGEKQKYDSMLKEQGVIWEQEAGEDVHRRRKLRRLTRRRTKDYSSFLQSQIKEKLERREQDRRGISPHELAMNRSMLQRLGVLTSNIQQ